MRKRVYGDLDVIDDQASASLLTDNRDTEALRGERDDLRKRLFRIREGIKVLKAQLEVLEECLRG